MFHVSTMLPYTPDDIQQVERKRHLGNDVVLVVFCDGVTKFDPACISSQFITVIMVVEKQPFEVGKPTRYKIKFASKHGVKPVPPTISPHEEYELGSQLRSAILTKLINTERAALKSTHFLKRERRTRLTLLNSYVNEFSS